MIIEMYDEMGVVIYIQNSDWSMVYVFLSTCV